MVHFARIDTETDFRTRDYRTLMNLEVQRESLTRIVVRLGDLANVVLSLSNIAYVSWTPPRLDI